MKEEDLNELKQHNMIQSESDIKMYEILFKSLSKEDSEVQLPPDFRKKLGLALIRRKKEERFEKFILFAGAIVLFFVTLITLAVFGVFDHFSSMGNLQWYLAIFFALAIVFRKIEKRYLRTN